MTGKDGPFGKQLSSSPVLVILCFETVLNATAHEIGLAKEHRSDFYGTENSVHKPQT